MQQERRKRVIGRLGLPAWRWLIVTDPSTNPARRRSTLLIETIIILNAYFSASVWNVIGSTQNLLDPVKLFSMQDDARSHRISSEVLKRSLYSSVISSSPYRRRQSMQTGDYRRSRPPSMHSEAPSNPNYVSVPVAARWAQSLPVSPAESHVTSPIHSPTNLHHWNTFMSRGATPRNSTPDAMEFGSTSTLDVEEDSWKGLPSLFKPRPRYIPGAPMRGMSDSLDETMELSFDNSRTACEGSMMDRQYQYQSLASPM